MRGQALPGDRMPAYRQAGRPQTMIVTVSGRNRRPKTVRIMKYPDPEHPKMQIQAAITSPRHGLAGLVGEQASTA
jgi:hypothetical protein